MIFRSKNKWNALYFLINSEKCSAFFYCRSIRLPQLYIKIDKNEKYRWTLWSSCVLSRKCRFRNKNLFVVRSTTNFIQLFHTKTRKYITYDVLILAAWRCYKKMLWHEVVCVCREWLCLLCCQCRMFAPKSADLISIIWNTFFPCEMKIQLKFFLHYILDEILVRTNWRKTLNLIVKFILLNSSNKIIQSN